MAESKKVLVIGSGWEQYELLKTIKEMGCKIIATHPSLNADGFRLADATYVKDSRDIKAHINIAETHDIDAVVTDNCDFSFYTAAIVASKLKLSFASIQSAIYSNDKFAQREQCAQFSIVQPEYRKVRNLDDLDEAVKSIDFPMVLKPVDSRGTFGVTVIENKDNLKNAFYDAIDNSHSRTLICEKFIPGVLVTVDGFCFKNGHRSLAVASRKFEKGSKPVTKEIIYPAQFDKTTNEKLLKNHNDVVKALGYKYGHTHGEYILTEKGDIYLVECANRGGGVYTSTVIVPLITEINLNEVLLNQSLGIDTYNLSESEGGYMKKSVMLTFLDFEVDRVIKSINLEEVKKLPYTVRFRTIYSENDMVESVQNCASRHSMLVIAGKNAEETIANLNEFKSRLHIIYHD
jgi:biotin carboxylase